MTRRRTLKELARKDNFMFGAAKRALIVLSVALLAAAILQCRIISGVENN